MSQLRERPRVDGEAEVDLGRHVAAVATRWWLVLLGVVVGVVVALLVSVGGKDVYRAKALVYPGQPLSAGGSASVPSLNTTQGTVSQIARSEAAIRRASEASGYAPAAKLRRHVSVQATQSGNAARSGQAQLFNIVVTGSSRRETAAAANQLAKIVVSRVSGYADTKIKSLRDQIAAAQQELNDIEQRIEQVRQELNRGGLSTTDRLILLTLRGQDEQRRTTVQEDLATRQQLLAQAVDVEQARVVEPAVSQKVTAQSRRNQLIVGGVVGFLLGLVAALLWEPVARRYRRP